MAASHQHSLSGSGRVFGQVTIALMVLLYIILGTAEIYGQQTWVRVYETEEDLWESYQEGEITFAQWRDLVVLFRTEPDSVFQPIADLAELPGYSPLDTAIGDSTLQIRGKPGLPHTGFDKRATLRWGYNLPLEEGSDDDGYVYGRWRSARWRVIGRGRSGNGKWDGFTKRGIAYHWPNNASQLTLGNFEPRFGLGLVVGRRDRVLGRTRDTELTGSIWQPSLSNYNGVQFEQSVTRLVRLTILGSRIQNTEYREDLAAGFLSFGLPGGSTRTGLTWLVGGVSNRTSRRRFAYHGLGASVVTKLSEYKLTAEIASAGNAAAAAARLIKPLGPARFSLTMWSYDPGFVLPTSGGPAHPGRQRIELLADELDYYSRSAGEQGFLARLRAPGPAKMTVESSLEIFSDRREKTKNISGKLGLRYALPQRTTINVYLRGLDQHREHLGEYHLYAGCFGRTSAFSRGPFAWRLEYGILKGTADRRTNSARLELQHTWRINSQVRFTPRFRYVDRDLSTAGDGYYYLYFTESIIFSTNYRLELVAVIKKYEDSSRETYTDIRVRAGWRL